MPDLLTRFFALLFAVVLAFPSTAQSQERTTKDLCAPPGYRTEVRPNASGPPTEVAVGMRLLDLTEINDVDQTISVDFAVRMQWIDPRLADLSGCNLPKEAVWFPEMIMENSGRIFDRWPKTVSVEKGGRATYMQRMSGTFSSYHNLAGFPFDDQLTTLRFLPLHWSDKKLVLRNDDVFTGMAPVFNISDWSVDGVEASVVTRNTEAVQQDRSGYELTISAKRDIGYYIWKIFFPIALIVAMSWSVFWIDPMQFSTQIGLSATSVLTMIAFIFATTNMLPKLGYVTTLDIYIAGTTLFVFFAMLQSLSTGFLFAQGHKNAAQRLDVISRFVFPVAFALFCAVVLVM